MAGNSVCRSRVSLSLAESLGTDTLFIASVSVACLSSVEGNRNIVSQGGSALENQSHHDHYSPFTICYCSLPSIPTL
jgi:hypothetical protein